MKKLRLILPVLLLAAAIGIAVFLLPGKKNEIVKEEFFAMDTVMDISLYPTKDTDEKPDVIMAELRDRIYEMERELSVTKPDSDVGRLNKASGNGEWIPVSEDAWELISEAVAVSRETKVDGYATFDPTLYPIVRLWGFTTGTNRVPGGDEIKKELEKVGFGNIELGSDPNKREVRLAKGAEMDLGACAKGFLSDALCEIMKKHKVNGIVSLGGNVQSVGTKDDGEAFSVGIVDPKDGQTLTEVIRQDRDQAVVTSGNYERYFEKDGKRYHHIMDERTGAPADSGLASVTVVGPRGVLCDAYATALFVMGEEKANEFLKSHTDYHAAFIYEDGYKKGFEIQK